MDFHYSPEDEAFRLELRTWLEANTPVARNSPCNCISSIEAVAAARQYIAAVRKP